MKSFVVFGMGRFGSSVAKTISAAGCEVLAVDRDASCVQAVAKVIPHAVIADFTKEEALRELGIENYDAAIVAAGSDLETAILTTVLLKEIGVKYVVAKAVNPRHAEILYKVGADRVVHPEVEMGERLGKALTQSDILDRINLSSEYSIVEISVPRKWQGKTILELDLRRAYGVNVLAIRRQEELIVSPIADELFTEHDIVVVLGNNDVMKKLFEL